MTTRERFARNMRIVREDGGVSLQALAERTGMPMEYLARIEAAEVDFDTDDMDCIAAALDRRAYHLLLDDPFNEPPYR